MSEVRNVIIIGSGPSGYTAAIYLARAQMKPLVLAGEAAGGQLMLTTEVENYPGFPEGIQGPELMENIRKQAEKFGAEIMNVNVSKVDFSGEVKKVYVGETEYAAKTVILTVGARARMLKVGEEKLLGRGVSTCATCDAAFFKEKTVFQIGGGDVAMEDLLALRKFTPNVTLVHRGDEGSLRASKIMQQKAVVDQKVPVLWNSEVVGVKGEQKLEAIVVKNNKTGEQKELPAQGLFLAIGHVPATDFLVSSVEVDSHKYVITRMVRDGIDVRKEYIDGYPTMTSVNGVFAAGDVVDFHYRQAVTAAGMGTQAALDVEKFLTGSVSGY